MLLFYAAVACVVFSFLAGESQAQDDVENIEQSMGEDDAVPDESPQEAGGLSTDLKIEEVYITGSLLPKGNFESNAPITTITSDQFEISNAINIEQLLNTMPQILTGADRTSTFGLGWATADLRGLGTIRT